jgi:hypothetical protein
MRALLPAMLVILAVPVGPAAPDGPDGLAQTAVAQTVTVKQNVNLRPDPSSEYAPMRLLRPGEPPLTLLDPSPHSGYYYVVTARAESGYVWTKFVTVSSAPALAVNPGPGVPGSATVVGCGDGRWKHVYHPSRLLVLQNCVTITGTIVDATNRHEADGMRHEQDGDTHGWLQVDSPFARLINPGNASAEQGNLVFEIICHYKVTQADAKPACQGFSDAQRVPPVGTHVAITGTLIRETNHAKWNEIHPVTKVKAE